MRHPFQPVYDGNSKILILGSFPSVKSRETQYYYGNPRNRFWAVLSTLLGVPEPQDTAGKEALLRKYGIALYDVLCSCEIKGSADTSIKQAYPNDFSEILRTAEIRMIFTNGKKACELYRKLCQKETGRECICLKSTSPANAAANFDTLLADWAKIMDYLEPEDEGKAEDGI